MPPARFAVPLAKLLEPGSNDQRTALCLFRADSAQGFIGRGIRLGLLGICRWPRAPKGRAISHPGDCIYSRDSARARSASRQPTMKGGGAAGVATLGAAGVEVAQNVLAEIQSGVLPLVLYLDTLRWVFIAVALGGVALTIYARLDDSHRGRR
ncbi:hypothetical protein [Primorskyibacter marinus]|uniref:hypothetical protein n=1 Tax=Primorskyibacter marinus TaxID=1977320 RepID=UPI001E2A73AC|nr:hypothetical protein [Primorskyibacter marinus]